MKVSKLKIVLLRELAAMYRKSPDDTWKFDQEDAKRLGTPLETINGVLSELKSEGLATFFFGAWKISTAGLESIEQEDEDEDDSDPSLRDRVDQLELRVKILEELIRSRSS